MYDLPLRLPDPVAPVADTACPCLWLRRGRKPRARTCQRQRHGSAVVNDNPMDFDKDLTDADVARYVSLPIEEQIRYEDSIRKGMARTNVNIENVGRSSGWVTYQGDKVTIK